MDAREIKLNKEAEIIAKWHERGKKKSLAIFSISSFYESKLGIFFLVFGIAFAALFGSSKEYVTKYNSHPSCINKTSCNITFSLNEEFPSPAFLYYELDGFDQNYETYFTSFSESQLGGNYLQKSEIEECNKAITNEFMGYLKDFTGKFDLIPSDPATPCGYIPYTMFNG